ncbi:hypothetical protein NKH57_30790 [Mesorhizobium sp. M1050]|uniref:hypothetical protein n=1 Tax=Mesorhizobium sp. M1050 TaxID=2957051 RepID=UPI0033352389
MANLPGYCPSCGTIFSVPNIVGGGGNVRITMIGNVINCPNPKCGKTARLADGEFNINANEASLISGPPLTRTILNQLQNISNRAKAHEITPEEAVEQVAQIAPELGRVMERAITLGLPILSFLVALIALYLQYEGNRSSDEFETAALSLMARQTQAVEVLATSKKDEPNNRVDDKGSNPAKAKADKKSVTVKSPSKRRNHINDERRRKLIEQRKDFPRGR